MKQFHLLLAAALVALSAPAHAAWLQGNVTEINTINDGTNDGVYVGLSATTGCTYNSFVILSSDPYFASIYATILTAKTTGRQIKFLSVYCASSGYARGNQYTML